MYNENEAFQMGVRTAIELFANRGSHVAYLMDKMQRELMAAQKENAELKTAICRQFVGSGHATD